jgi:hypothetical protein
MRSFCGVFNNKSNPSISIAETALLFTYIANQLPNFEITGLASFSETGGTFNCQLQVFFDSWDQMFDIHGHLHLTDVYSARPVQTLDNFSDRHKHSVIQTGCR